MLTKEEILFTLDNSNNSGDYSHFIALGHPYVYLIDCRLNIFRGNDNQWAIAAERLGYSERGGLIEIEITYFGNCLTNLEEYNGQLTNNYSVFPADQNVFLETTDEMYLKPDSKYWMVNGSKVELSTNKEDYIENGINLKEYEPGQISIAETARLAVIKYRNLFRANDIQLYKSIPQNLKKILVLDEWYHKDFVELTSPSLSDKQIKATYDLNKQFGLKDIDFETFVAMLNQQKATHKEANKKEWKKNRPSSYETWRQLAKVIATGDLSFYKPNLQPNTHWANWPDSGSL